MESLAGSFLIADPRLEDPNFSRTVILLLGHGEEGAFGLVVNRPAPDVQAPIPVFRGGPCPSEGLLVLHGHGDWPGASPPGDLRTPGIFGGDQDCLVRAFHAAPEGSLRVRVFAGYSGWGPGQLEHEIGAGAWAVAPASGQLLFEVPPEELWELLAPHNRRRSTLN